jgi:hypothetical protein
MGDTLYLVDRGVLGEGEIYTYGHIILYRGFSAPKIQAPVHVWPDLALSVG